MKKLIAIFSIILTFTSFNGQKKQVEELKLSDFNFESIFGTVTSEPKSTYCLLGTGFFRAQSSANIDSLILGWIKAHPNASVIPISAIEEVENNEPETKLVYCWIIDDKDTLNNYLVKNGCIPGGTMIRPKTWDEMETWEKELYEDTNERPSVKVFIDEKTYDNFLEQIKSAELYARENKLGIWEKEGD